MTGSIGRLTATPVLPRPRTGSTGKGDGRELLRRGQWHEAEKSYLIPASACLYSFPWRQTRVRPEAEQTYFNADLSPARTAHFECHRCRLGVPVRQTRSVRHRQRADGRKREHGYREELVAGAGHLL